jgi:O-antigen ligase
MLKERPVFGYGFGEKEEINKNVDAHIVWLRNAVDGGIIYTGLLIILFIEILRTFLKNKTLEDDERKLFRTLFFVAFLITFLEPNYLIGSVQGEVVYWLLISLLLKKGANYRRSRKQKFELATEEVALNYSKQQ